ncbi:MAG: anhydro-N-acetylmuramic acid kinase, partial [Psychroserpens sp.]|nr:anhydro-N-acetylmuramic acid kinase [Psychroserpens sp.]
MIKTDFYVVGVMSGTSLDGVDLVYAKFEKNTTWKFEIIHYSTLPYPKFWKESLSHLTLLSKKELNEIDIKYT